MACSSSLTKEDLRQMKSFEKEDILTQSAKNVRSLQERTMSPEDVELTDNENSFEEKYSCDDEEDDNVDTDEYDDDEDTRFLDVCMDGDIEDLVQLLEEMAQAGETLSTEMLNCADSTDRVRMIKVKCTIIHRIRQWLYIILLFVFCKKTRIKSISLRQMESSNAIKDLIL